MDRYVILEGLTFGSLYALVAVSFNVLYRPTNVFNFAQGELVMLGGMLGATAIASFGFPWPAAALVAVVVVAAIAFAEERIAVTPVLRRSSTSTSWVITTLAVSLIIANIVGRVWDTDPREVAAPFPLSNQPRTILGTEITTFQIALVLVTVAIVVGVERLYRTRSGKAILAVAEDRDAALLRGIDPEKLTRWSFLVGGALAALAGLLAAPLLFASITLGPLLLSKGFIAAAAGGIGDNRGALIAGWVIGTAEAVGARLFSPGLSLAFTFGLLLVILMVRPEGLLGHGEARRV